VATRFQVCKTYSDKVGSVSNISENRNCHSAIKPRNAGFFENFERDLARGGANKLVLLSDLDKLRRCCDNSVGGYEKDNGERIKKRTDEHITPVNAPAMAISVSVGIASLFPL